MRTADWTDSVSVLDRVTAVLDAFTGDDGLGVSELARRARLPKSTVSRIVADLLRRGYLDREGSRVRLGMRLFELGQSVDVASRLRALAHPVLRELRATSGETAVLAVPDEGHVVVTSVLAGRQKHPGLTVGARLPAPTTALGRAALAVGGSEAGDLTPEDRTRIRRTGVARGEDDPSAGLTCVASAVRGLRGDVLAVVGLLGRTADLAGPHLGELVHSAARALSAAYERSAS